MWHKRDTAGPKKKPASGKLAGGGVVAGSDVHSLVAQPPEPIKG